MNKIDLNNIPTKNKLSFNDALNVVIVKKVAGHDISYKTRFSFLQNQYINVEFIDNMIKTLNNLQDTVNTFIKTISGKDYIDVNYLSKENSIYKKEKLLTSDRLKILLSKYYNADLLDVDIQNCIEHARNTATTLGNYLGMIAAQAKSSNANKTAQNDSAIMITEALASVAEACASKEKETPTS